MPPTKQVPAATAVSSPTLNISRSSTAANSLLNRCVNLSSSQQPPLPDSSTHGSTDSVPEAPPVSIAVSNSEGNDDRHNSSMKSPTDADNICAGNQTLAPVNGALEREGKHSIGRTENANGDRLIQNASEVKPKKKTMKVLKVVKKVVKRRVPKSSLKTIAAPSSSSSTADVASGEIVDDGRERICSGENVALPIRSSVSSEDKGFEKLTEISDHHLTGCMPEQEVEMADSSISAPFDVEKCDGGVNISVQETDYSSKLLGVALEVENLYSDEKVASVSGIPGDGKDNKAIRSQIPANDEKEEASVSRIPVNVDSDEAIRCRTPADDEKKEASVSEIPVAGEKTECILEESSSANENPNEDSVADKDQVAGTIEYVERKRDGETSNRRIVMSGELEALERRRRRRTELFIGGLNKAAKEEDVRKVFEEAGDIVELRLMIHSKTGKNMGYAFVRYASAEDAKKALEKYSNVEILGKQCSVAPVRGNDTIFLGNIDKKWKDEDVMKWLQEIGIEKIDRVTVMANPTNVERNRGFAFLELETCKDAQVAFKKLQNKNHGKLKNIKVAWAEPLSEPEEEEILKVKSVYAEYLPPSWDEEKVTSYFAKFGEIENVVLSQNLHASRRKDFAFINFTTREAAVGCIEYFNRETLHDEGSQVNIKVSLAKPAPKAKPPKKVAKSDSKEISRQREPNKYHVKPIETRNTVTPVINVVNQRKDDIKPAGTSSKLEQLLAERALRKQMHARLSTSIANENYTRPITTDDYARLMANEEYARLLPGKRPLAASGDNLSYLDPRGYGRMRVENPFPVERLSHGEVPSGFDSLPYYQQRRPDYILGHRYSDYPNSLQREEEPYRGIARDYRRY